MKSIPQVGSQVRVTTRHRDPNINNPTGYKEFVLVGTVLQPDKWLLPSEFAIATGNPSFPKSIVNISSVVNIDYQSGKAGASVATGTRQFKVTSKSTGKDYIVTYASGKVTCTCTGFGFRKYCKHSTAVANKLKKG